MLFSFFSLGFSFGISCGLFVTSLLLLFVLSLFLLLMFFYVFHFHLVFMVFVGVPSLVFNVPDVSDMSLLGVASFCFCFSAH